MSTIAIYRNQLFQPSEPFIADQARMLKRHEVVMAGWVANGSSDLATVDLARVSAWRRLEHKLFATPTVFTRLLRDHHPSLVHAHFAIDAVYALPIARQLGVPFVTTLHGFDVSLSNRALLTSGHPSWANYLIRRRRLAATGSLFVCVSEHVRQQALALGFPADRTEVIYIGVDTNRFVPSPTRAPRTIVHVARLVEKKGTRHLIIAFATVLREFPDAELIIVGAGPLRAALETLATRLGVARSVKFLGALSREDVRAHTSRASVFCLPSVTARSGDTEGLPISLLEAMSCAVPVVATEHGGAPEVITDEKSGYLVPEHDEHLLALRLVALLRDDALRNAVGAAGRARVVADFDLRTNTATLEDRYAELIGRTRTLSGRT